MTDDEILSAAVHFAEEEMKHVRPSHGWDHVQRVIRNAELIGSTEPEADMFIVRLAAVLHDISRHEQDLSQGKICHAEKGAVRAEKFLLSIGLDADRSRHVSRCIYTHRFRKNSPPASLEAEILFDADKLESIGAVGIGRAFLFAGEVGAVLHNPEKAPDETESYSGDDTAYREYSVKLKKVKDRMLTKKGKDIAVNRNRFMEEFFSRLTQETSGLA